MKKIDQSIHLNVRDEGSGIPLRVRNRILEPFITTKQSGTGLGLAIVQRRVEQLQGEIEIESPLQQGGTRFSISFPA